MTPASRLNRKIDSVADDLSVMMNDAVTRLRQFEGKLREFQRQAGLMHRGARAMQALEIAAALATIADLFRQARALATRASADFASAPDLAPRGSLEDADVVAMRRVSGQAAESLAAFERLIAESERQVQSHLDEYRRACAVPEITGQAASTFKALMNAAMASRANPAA